ncbi:MAG: Mini-ribonuclease 3 [Clostridia bacterium]|nr:Mini-ribonuclease 3 [Clostridia bacterium]
MEKDNKQIYELNAIKLAYMGDSVFSLYVRKHFIVSTDKKNADLNKCVNAIVCATNQSKLMDIIRPMLDEVECEIVNRAKNLHFNNIAKNSSPEDYTKATEFEALLGYLYLTKQDERLQKFIDISLENYYDSGRN